MIGLTAVKDQVQLDRRLDRGGAQARRGRARHRQAHAALRVPRPAGHRQDRRGPDRRQDLLRVRPAGLARRGGGAPGRPGRRVPGRHRDQDQRADRLGARRGAVHRRGLQPGERGRRAGRPVRQRGGPGPAQAGRGRPRRPDHHPGRLRAADGELPGQQPRPDVAVRGPDQVPRLHARPSCCPWPTWPSSAGASCSTPTPGRCSGGMFEDVGRRRLADELGNGRFVRSLLEKAGQRPGRPGDGRGRRSRPRPTWSPCAAATSSRPSPS